ncbi:hypothetical protein [Desulfospira joergensenii]|uniref:hypothetical protein n=1 Tax=Desulfospira joergensenii TaxID=53329 RepID=UPI0003B41968|nr:hypothetical protein [Desulfospira joergensenii]
MKLDNELIKNRFDDIGLKVDAMIDLCQRLQEEKTQMLSRIKELEAELKERQETEIQISEQDALIQSKIDGLLTKLDDFGNEQPSDRSLNLGP